MGKAFWLGIIGVIFGILGAIIAVMMAGIREAVNVTGASSLYTNAAGAFVFSIVGMVGGILEKRRIIGAAPMIIGGIAVLISISLFGALAAYCSSSEAF
jgi:hypothetical protein